MLFTSEQFYISLYGVYLEAADWMCCSYQGKFYISLYGVYPEAADRMCCSHQGKFNVSLYGVYPGATYRMCCTHQSNSIYSYMEYTLRRQLGCAVHIKKIQYIRVWSISRGGKLIQGVYSDLYKP